MHHHLILLFALYVVAILVAAAVVPGVRVRGVKGAVVTVLVFAVVNFLLGFLVRLVFGTVLFVPAVFTFGLAWLLVPFLANAVLVWVTDWIVEGFEAAGIVATLGTAAVLTAAHVVARVLHF